jgi:hypothetical protein
MAFTDFCTLEDTSEASRKEGSSVIDELVRHWDRFLISWVHPHNTAYIQVCGALDT